MGCHKNIAAQIVSQGGDYLLALKGNHPVLCTDVERLFGDEVAVGSAKAHGRAETGRRRTTGASKRAAPWRRKPPRCLLGAACVA